ncbi:hypothetical protein [Agromyces sp. Soil535]|uniref:hypothetical protein n=1 Tax=Agromyces sp. Soil535 TaxID=1736390 RepID=UPI0006F46C48|nr:hypothetical protein [Agromyces sp. Soil535]KRE23024.1 hypothetical protein ASG80_09170 [Agromyces sp. Soil535]
MSRIRSIAMVRLCALAVAAAAAVGLVLVDPAVATTASAASEEAPEITVKWVGDDSSAASVQPERDPSSPHFGDFAGLSASVSQITHLRDQAVQVRIEGFSRTTSARDGASNTVLSAMNFVQAMQCWGDPAAENFRETCQWGGWAAKASSGINAVAPRESYYRAPIIPAGVDVPFVTATGQVVTGVAKEVPGKPTEWPIATLFDSSTSNEVVTSRIGDDGTGVFNFEVQSAIQAPHLGCGSPTTSNTCYLVIVPRGSHFGGTVGEGQCALDAKSDVTFEPYSYGQANAIQEGSPINTRCDYWDNRIVVPLEFEPVGNQCPLGAAERGTVGSQLVVAAMSSWQPALCQSIGSVYSFSANPDATGRSQLLSARTGLAFTSASVGSDSLTTQDKARLAETEVAYAPVTISAPVVAFYQEDVFGKRTSMKMTPRLLAKLLTQSYMFQIPKGQGDSVDHLGSVNLSYLYLWQDPEFTALNPDVTQAVNPALILPGPASADAIAQLWRWVQADDEAAAWLAGEPDAAGMTVNPYYLPKGHPNAKVPVIDDQGVVQTDDAGNIVYRPVGLASADGTPIELAKATLSTFAKADETRGPKVLSQGMRNRFDSLQSSPFTENLPSAARDAARADPHAKTRWDPTRYNASGELGDWVSDGPQLPGSKFIITITDSASAARYGLGVAELQLPDRPGVFAGPTVDAMDEALSAFAPVLDQVTKQIDPARVPDQGYPLTMVTYAAVNLTGTDASARRDYARMIDMVTTSGQKPGTDPGSLPAGYLPLPEAMVAQAAAAADRIEAFVSKPKPGSSSAAPQFGGSTGGAAGSVASPPSAAAAGGQITSGSSMLASDDVTPLSNTPLLAQAALGVALIVGLGGAVFAPMLMRPRRSIA